MNQAGPLPSPSPGLHPGSDSGGWRPGAPNPQVHLLATLPEGSRAMGFDLDPTTGLLAVAFRGYEPAGVRIYRLTRRP